MALTNEQRASLNETSVLRVVRAHGLLGHEGLLVRVRHEETHPGTSQNYIAVSALDGSLINGSWFPNRFDLVEPQTITSPLPAGTLLRCVDADGQGDRLTELFYRLASNDLTTSSSEFLSVYTLDGQGVVFDGQLLYQFMSHRFVYYPDSAPAEPTTEKGTTMSHIPTALLDRSTAATLPIGARVIFTDGGERQGKTFVLDRAGIDSDGDFHGSFEGANYGHFLRWSYFSLPSPATTSPITREIAESLPSGTVLVCNDPDHKTGAKFTLERHGIDSDGDFRGVYEGDAFASYGRWSRFDLAADSATPTPEPTENPLAAELGRVQAERNAFEADLTRVIDALRQEAIDREWCSEYDSFMERLGFEARCTRTFTVRRRATIEWNEDIEASSEDDAREKADENEPSYVRDLHSPEYIDLENIDIVDVEEA